MTIDAYITIAILALTFGLLIKTRIPPAAVFLGALALTMTFRLAPLDQTLDGFSNSGMLTVGALFMVAAGMYSTGAITMIGADGILTTNFLVLPETEGTYLSGPDLRFGENTSPSQVALRGDAADCDFPHRHRYSNSTAPRRPRNVRPGRPSHRV